MGQIKWHPTSSNYQGSLSGATTCKYTTVSVVKPLLKHRPKRKLQGQLFTTCQSCVDRIICYCLDHAHSGPSDFNDDIPLSCPVNNVLLNPPSSDEESDG